MLHYKNTTKAKFATNIRWNLLIMIKDKELRLLNVVNEIIDIADI